MRRTAVAVAAAAALALPVRAQADVGVDVVTKVVPAGGAIRVRTTAGLPVYAVPAAYAPRRHRCRRNAICEPTTPDAPGPPFVRLGAVPRLRDPYARRTVDLRVPRGLAPGPYRVFVYCAPCGRTLIVSGDRVAGETIRVLARPTPRAVALPAGAAARAFLVSEPRGVVRVLRLTVPHGLRVSLTARIAGAGVGIATQTADCRRRGAVDVCDQAVEWCPLPAAVWRLRVRKSYGPAARVVVAFLVA
jgi:hypothetical protein